MDFIVAAAAKPSLAYAREGVRFFEERLRPLGKVELRYVKAGPSEEVSRRLLDATSGCLRIALDERGENWTTRRFEALVREWQLRAVKHVAFLIGAADGASVSIEEFCAWGDCISWEALVSITKRVPRIYEGLRR